MNSLKTLVGATLLAALAYGVYVGITKKPGGAPGNAVSVGSEERSSPLATRDTTGLSEAPPFTSLPAPVAAAAPAAPELGPESASTEAAPQANFDYGPASDVPPAPAFAEAVPPEVGATREFGPAAAMPAEPDSSVVQATATNASFFQQQMLEASHMLDAGRLAEAHLALSRFYGDPSLLPEEHAQLTDLLGQLAGTVIYSREHLLEPPHRLGQGETLDQIATQCGTSSRLLAKINGIQDPNVLQPGQELKIVRGPFHAVVDLSDREMVLLLGGDRYAGKFKIGIGAEQPPREGRFTVQGKQEKPHYYAPDRVYTPEDPQNPLGEYKLELGDNLSIHGTNDPTSLDRDDPRGCIRLSPRDAEDVFDILTIGSEVVIQR